MKPKIVFAIALLAVLSGCSAGKDNQESNTDTGRAIPAPALRVLHEDSEEEKEALSESFVGITNDGEIRNDLYAIEATGISTEPIRNSTIEKVKPTEPIRNTTIETQSCGEEC